MPKGYPGSTQKERVRIKTHLYRPFSTVVQVDHPFRKKHYEMSLGCPIPDWRIRVHDEWTYRQLSNSQKSYRRSSRWKNQAKATELQREWRKKHPEYYRRRAVADRYAAIDKLGGKCVKCGITDKRVLQINHLNGNGIRELRPGAISFYRAVAQGRRTIDDLDVRCANCNILYEFEVGRRKG